MTERADYLQLAASELRSRKPNPSGAKPLFTGFGEPDLELLETAEVTHDRVGKRAGRCVVPARRHGAPEQTMVHVSARVVADRSADFLRNLDQVEQQPHRRALLQLGEFFQRRVQLLHIRRVMPVVMQHHRACVNGRLEGCIVIGQRRQQMSSREQVRRRASVSLAVGIAFMIIRFAFEETIWAGPLPERPSAVNAVSCAAADTPRAARVKTAMALCAQ